MPDYDWVARREYDRVVKECDELKHANICLRSAYAHEHTLAHKYFEQAAALQRDSIAERDYRVVVEERDELKRINACFKTEYEHERGLAQKYFEQAAALRRDRNMAEARYGEAKSRLEERYAELEKLRKENESMRNSLRDKRECVLDTKMENEKLRLEIDNLTRANSSIRAERDDAYKQVNSLRSQLEGARETSKHYAEQATRYQNERDKAYEDATRQRTDYTNLMSECAKLKKKKDDFCIEACELRSALCARNALLQIMFLATGLHDCMLQELFNCHFHTSEASFDADLTRRMIQHCINNNSTIIDTLTGYRFDIADRLVKAIEVRNIYGMPRKQGDADTLAPEKKPICDARHVANKKKKDVRAKPEQSQRRAKRGKAKPHQKGK